MGGSSSFKDEFTFVQRLEESRDIIAKYPDRVPVIVERYAKCDLPQLEKKKYLVPRDLSVGHFIHILSSRLRLPPGKALFVFVKNTLPQTATLVDSVYQSFRDEDGFLYMYYSTEKTFVKSRMRCVLAVLSMVGIHMKIKTVYKIQKITHCLETQPWKGSILR
ncbi:hypothetical protein Ahy_A09g045177 isoform A [Arachis hypogaea]|uniref:Autophagy-related protein n=1 Tax=Arachis hypogaea TaxID=3818 RepID=A0A445BLS3_ARAHY|nr:hypothetical protein Ahy_A09g045177 isoform A [Arachis hypogaea]